MNNISVVIPVRKGGNAAVTLKSLALQEYQDFEVIVSWDDNKGANWARNQGAQLARGKYLLFSDDDIEWEPTAILNLLVALTPEFSYSYGSYLLDGRMHCTENFDARRLRHRNFISTMSLIRKDHFIGFDENIHRLQDWDLWLSMLEHGYIGNSCGRKIFTTARRKGITYGGPVSWVHAQDVIIDKHNLHV